MKKPVVALTFVVLVIAYFIYGCTKIENSSKPMWQVDAYLKQLPLGNIAFNAPSTMKVDEQTDIHVLVSASSSMDQIRAELERRIGSDKRLEAYAIKLGPLMEAHLTGQNFTIQAVTPEKQAVASSATTEWQWQVIPLKGGHQALHLTMNVIVYIRGDSEPHTVKTFDKAIEVEVTTIRRVTDWSRDNWFWLLPLIGAVTAIVKWKWKKSKDKTLDQPAKGPMGFTPESKDIKSDKT